MSSRKTTKRRQLRRHRLHEAAMRRLARLQQTARCGRDKRQISRFSRIIGVELETVA